MLINSCVKINSNVIKKASEKGRKMFRYSWQIVLTPFVNFTVKNLMEIG